MLAFSLFKNTVWHTRYESPAALLISYIFQLCTTRRITLWLFQSRMPTNQVILRVYPIFNLSGLWIWFLTSLITFSIVSFTFTLYLTRFKVWLSILVTSKISLLSLWSLLAFLFNPCISSSLLSGYCSNNSENPQNLPIR